MEPIFKGIKSFNSSVNESFSKKKFDDKLDEKIVSLVCELDNKFINNHTLLSNNEFEKLFINEALSKNHLIEGSIEEYIYECASSSRKSTFHHDSTTFFSSSSLSCDVFIDDNEMKNDWKSLTSSLKDEDFINVDWHVLVKDVINGVNSKYNYSEFISKMNRSESFSSNDEVFESNSYIIKPSVNSTRTKINLNIPDLKRRYYSVSLEDDKAKCSSKNVVFNKRKTRKQLSVSTKNIDQTYYDVNNENIGPNLNNNYKKKGNKVQVTRNDVINYNTHFNSTNEKKFFQKSNSKNFTNTPRTQEEHEKRFFALIKMKQDYPKSYSNKHDDHNFLHNKEIKTSITPVVNDDDNYFSILPDVDSEFINFINESVHKVSQSNFENFYI